MISKLRCVCTSKDVEPPQVAPYLPFPYPIFMLFIPVRCWPYAELSPNLLLCVHVHLPEVAT